ncbi:MAG: M6 family metalloprotease domain-containing protein [candidate division Zixibacteria bacterium]|nr:M6 family metalloprotease domain-containing protein [candidate division Zixibacteria bacterium]
MRKYHASVILTCLLILSFYSAVMAVPPSEEVIQRLKDEGRYEAYLEQMADARSRGVDTPNLGKDGKAMASSFADVTDFKALVILIDFPDKLYSAGLAAATTSDFQTLLFSDGVVSTGSMRDFYIENSFGEFVLSGDVVGWYTAANSSSYYTNECDGSHGMGAYPHNARALVEEAVAMADADVNFADYDNDNDGYVDGIFVIHAGTGYEESGSDCEIHSHQWSISPIEKDGVVVSTYSIEPEESPASGGVIPIGVFCHEFGHVLGLPDFYDTDYSSRGCGRWVVMAGGSYNNQSRTPAPFGAYSKYFLGWLDPINVTENMTDVQIPPAASSNVAYRLWQGGQYTSQYFLVENKQKYGFDSNLPGEGLLIWHIDESVGGNTSDWHPKLFLEPSDGRFDLQNNSNSGDTGDPYPGSHGVWEFNDETTPNSRSYSNATTEVAVWNISPSDSVMTANFDVHWSRPNISLDSYEFTDTAYGDSDGIFEEGETIQLVLQLSNKWKDATAANVIVTTDDPLISLTQSSASFGDIPDGASATNFTAPIEFEIMENHVSRIDSFFLEISADGGNYQAQVALEQNIGTINIIIIDDDASDSLETYYTESFVAKRKPYERWDKVISGSPSALDLRQYGSVIWFTGDYRDNPLSSNDIAAMKTYLDFGGCLFLTGQGVAKQLATDDLNFLQTYLKTDYDYTQYVPLVLADAGAQVLGGLDTMVIQSYGGATNQSQTDHLLPVNDGVVEALYFGGTDPAAISYSGSYKTVFFGFGFEALGLNEDRFARRDTVLARILDFFGYGGAVFMVADANGDGAVNVGDAAYIVNYIFRGGPPPIPIEAGEANGDCNVNIGDAVYLINYIFKSGPPPVNGCE